MKSCWIKEFPSCALHACPCSTQRDLGPNVWANELLKPSWALAVSAHRVLENGYRNKKLVQYVRYYCCLKTGHYSLEGTEVSRLKCSSSSTIRKILQKDNTYLYDQMQADNATVITVHFHYIPDIVQVKRKRTFQGYSLKHQSFSHHNETNLQEIERSYKREQWSDS